VRQPAKTPRAAQRRYVNFLQLSLSCLTKAVWIVAPHPSGRNEERALTLSDDPVRLKCGDDRELQFSASQRFVLIPDERYEGEWKSRTLDYIYGVSMPGEDGDLELFRWDWHPMTTPAREQPHLHVRGSEPELSIPVERLHVPTGRVAFEEVVRFIILELGADPNREDWKEILAESEARFKKFRTWS
jgi:hypothetical protein